MKKQTKHIKILNCFIYFSIIFFIGIAYFLLSTSYFKVSQKKENYIEVFFDINIEVIKSSLERCEKYYYKKFKGQNKQENQEEHRFSLNDNDSISSNTSHIPHFQTSQKNIDKNIRRKLRAKVLARKLIIKILIFLILLGIFYTILFYIFIRFLSHSYIYVKYYEQECICENEYHLIFNGVREMFFDENSEMFKMNVKEYLYKELEQLYVTRRKTNNYMNQNRLKLPSNFYEKFMAISIVKPCDLRLDDYFLNEDECFFFMNNATKYGLEITASYFVEEIRYADHFRRSLLFNKNITTYNLTLLGTKKYYEYYPKDPVKEKEFINEDPIHFFNSKTLNDLSIFYRNFMLPLYTQLRVINVDSIIDNLENIYFNLTLIFVLYMGIFFLIFVVYWVPFVHNLNQVLFRTKNLLSIIPKEVLMNINGIYSLFGIEDICLSNNEKKS